MKKGFLVLFMAMMIGCGKNESPSSSAVNYTGTWAAPCSSIGTKTSLIISGSSAVTQLESYDANTCTATLGFVIKMTSAFTIGSAVTGIDDAYKIDSTTQSGSITIKSDLDLAAFNSNSICGITTWAKNVETDISGKNCGTTLGTYVVGQVFYNIIKQSSTGGSTFLYLGDTSGANDAKTEAKRPVSLNTQSPLTKQ